MKILLPIDMSEYSKAAARACIQQFPAGGHQVHVFHAADWARRLPTSYQFAQGPEVAAAALTFRDQLLREAEDDVQHIASDLRRAGFTVTTEVRDEGEPRHAILDAAQRWPADLIVIGSHGRTGLDRFLLGSVSENVVRHAPCSVQVVRAQAPAAHRHAPASNSAACAVGLHRGSQS